MKFSTYNPTNEEKLRDYSYCDLKEAEALLERLSFDQGRLRRASVVERIALLKTVADNFRFYSDDMARMMTAEMGKPIVDSLQEVEKCARCADYFAEHLEEFLACEPVSLERDSKAYLQKDPLGVIFAIMPWNFPAWQLARAAIPAIAVGNSIMMKHSDITAGTAELLEKVFRRNIDLTLFANAHLSHESAAKIISDYRIRGVTFTGSTGGGRQVAQTAGAALKKTVLELGGSDPYLILQDADVNLAAEYCARSRMVNGGQSCVAAKRFFVHQSVHDEFVQKLSQNFNKYQHDDPLKMTTVRGPLAHKKFQTSIQQDVDKVAKRKVVTGGVLPEGKGAFYPATIILMDQNRDKLWDQEFFGPVACVWTFSDSRQAVGMANQSIYGLGSAIFSRDIERAQMLATELEAGIVAINEMVKSDPALPFGGVKDSGYGKELSKYGMAEFANLKSVTIGK